MKESMKSAVKCPFMIRFNFVNTYADDEIKPVGIASHTFVKKIKITFVNLHHSHDLSPEYHRIAIQKAGKLSLDLSKLKLVLSSLRKRPHMPTLELRKDLSEVVPHFQGISGQYCVNFWRKVHLYFMKHPSNTELTMEDAQNICDKKSCSNEDINTDDPIVKVNLRELFQNIIQQDTSSWKAISLLRVTKETCPGFDYRIHYNIDGVPDGFM